MSEDRADLIVTLALIALVAYMSKFVPGVTADNIAVLVIGAVVTRWLQKGAQQTAEKQAEKLQEAVVQATNNRSAENVNVEGENVEVTTKEGAP